MDDYHKRAEIVGKLKSVSRIACSPEGELFCIRGDDLYRGPIPSNKNVDWFSAARRVGKSEWSRYKLILFHPNGDLYATTRDGLFYKGPQPDNQHIPWMYDRAKKIGVRIWNQFNAMCFSPEGILYAIHSNGKLYRGYPPTDVNVNWFQSSTKIGDADWSKFTYFLSFGPDGKLWCIDKWNGNIYRVGLDLLTQQYPLTIADYLGWNYTVFRCFAFTKDKIIHKIMSFDFLVDEAETISESPQVIEEKIYDNRNSSATLKHTFTFKKSIKESSSFTHEHGFTFEMGTETTFKTGIPVIAEGEVKVSMNMSTSHTWNFTKTNETEIIFSSSTDVQLEAGKAVRMVATVMKAEINVPYKAKAMTMFGSEVKIRGSWKGVSHYNLTVKQEDYKK